MKKENYGFTRRRFIGSTVSVAAALQLSRAAGAFGLTPPPASCRLIPEQEVGPYYIADELLRSDITEGKPGVPLALRVVVIDSRTCRPLANAAIDIWHCDALGLYSGFTKQNPMGPGGPGGFGGPQHGDLSVANLQPARSGEVAPSFRADLVAYVDPTATPAATRRMRGPGGPPPSNNPR